MACIAAPLRIRLASSRSVPSPTPCTPFSIPRCLQISSNSGVEVLRAAGPLPTRVFTLRRCHLDRWLLNLAMLLVDLAGPLDLGSVLRGLEVESPASGSAKVAAMSFASVGRLSFTGR